MENQLSMKEILRLTASDGCSSDSTDCSPSWDFPVSTDPATLIERMDRLDLGGGWTLCCGERGWCVYFRAKHVDAWIEERTGEYQGLRVFGTVRDALELVDELCQSDPKDWPACED